ncbi:ABC transporter ATP-binding protein [Kumtagia ephedrae]|uniref:ABC transporter ATP-binding protein n=1 Tax=Kumtagia ephedrae TaxID=2116701 RepID=A0A2P7SJF0_9HYPH|nr:ABC transporter ATP-binding protein [Mesorhizobium ephedrae]PSJ62628.1 ABC transporter ATP-binding protein [Mesorhizobium ephedrae]
MAAIEFDRVSKSFGQARVLDTFSLSVEEGSLTVLCGPPKSGKSVLFRLVVGLETPDGGTIRLSGRDITHEPASARNIGYVPQSFALYPHLTVFDNIGYPMRLAGAPREEIARRVDRTAAMLSIGHLLRKTPDKLSGGEKQRVAVARGLMKDASVFLFDDPLVGLDYKLRERLMDELKQLCETLKATFFYATSDSLEALTMAQTLVVVDDGRLVERAGTLKLYAEPGQVRSLELIGFPKANVIEGICRNGRIEAAGLSLPAPAGLADGPVKVGIRPEHVRLGRREGVGADARVAIVEHLGSEIVVYLDLNGHPVTAAYAAGHAAPPEIDSAVKIDIDPARAMIFDPNSGALIGRCAAGGV